MRYHEQGSCGLAQAAMNWQQRYKVSYWVFEAWIWGDNVERVINWWMPKSFPSKTLIKFVTAVNRFDNLFINCISQCISQCISELHRSTVLLNKHWSKWSRCKLASAVNGLDNDALSGRLGAWSFFLKVHSGKRLKRPHKRTCTTSTREWQSVSKHRNSNPQHKLMLEHTMSF